MTKEELLREIKQRCLRFGDFTLKSGQKSLFYLDLRAVTISPLVLYIAEMMHEYLCGKDIEFEAIGGPSSGADPIVTAYLCSQRGGPHLRGFFVRKEEKDHGLKSLVIGSVRPGDKCVVVEDVTTTAGSLMKAVRAIREFGCPVSTAITVVDRSPIEFNGSVARKWLEHQEGIKFHSLFTLDDFGLKPDQAITDAYMKKAVAHAAGRFLGSDDPITWTDPASIRDIENLIAQIEEHNHSRPTGDLYPLDIYSLNSKTYKIAIRKDVYKPQI